MPEDSPDIIIKGKWVIKTDEDENSHKPKPHPLEFIPDNSGEELAVKVNGRRKASSQSQKKKQGLSVLFSNDTNNPESPVFKKFDDPVSDRDMVSKGIIWINAVHPIIEKFGSDSKSDPVRDENIANFVLMIVAQFYSQKEIEHQPPDEQYDPLLLFREHFFRLQLELRTDVDILYFDKEK